MPRESVELDTTRLDKLLRDLPGTLADNVRALAFSVEGKAKTKAPIDTGALKASIYTRTTGVDNWSQVQSEAKALNRDAELVSLPRPENEHIAIVGPSVAYAIDVELGTVRRSATPYLGPALREVEREVAAAMAKAIKDAAK